MEILKHPYNALTATLMKAHSRNPKPMDEDSLASLFKAAGGAATGGVAFRQWS